MYALPLGNILSFSLQRAIQELGYVGLLLLILAGGLDTSISILSQPRTLALSIISGATGIALPVGISLLLGILGFGYTALQSFAIGAALCSTSLGTIFAVLDSLKATSSPSDQKISPKRRPVPDLLQTRIGTILIGAALLDDIVALVISTVVAALGASSLASNGNSLSISPWTAARPIVSSILLIGIAALLARFISRPLARLTGKRLPSTHGHERDAADENSFMRLMKESAPLIATVAFVATLAAFITIAYEIGSSMLIGAFCAGAFMRYGEF